jgi:hypothetical protein
MSERERGLSGLVSGATAGYCVGRDRSAEYTSPPRATPTTGKRDRKMTSGSTRSRTKKTLRVATMFTGVAALTVGVTQAANAEDVAHALTRPALKDNAIRPNARAYGNIKDYEDCAFHHVDPTWVHVATALWEYTNSGNQYIDRSVCFGGAGTYSSPPGRGMYGECGGNNYGTIAGYENGLYVGFNFKPGTKYAWFSPSWSHYDTVVISKWAGTDTCPINPLYNPNGTG